MERRTKKMLLAILMILSVLATDFFVLGSGIMTYASQFNSETNNANVEFSVYFKEKDNRIDSIEKSIKAEDVKLYAEIKVKNEGYLKEGTVIELENSNFNLKNDILSSNTHINNIDGNKVILKQIGVGETVEIELGIKPAITDKITADYLSKTSTVKMIGSYVYSKAEDGQSIRTDKVVSINYVPDESIGAELETDVITNKVIAANGENKRIVQLLIKSGITNNEYPVKETKLTATIPQLGEETPEISAIAINELATNGKTEIDKLITENGLVEITLNNETSWMKNVYDEIVITYIYPETVDASKIEIITNSEITLYDSNETVLKAESKELSENEELNNSIIGRIENTTKELYKGKIYANLDLTYKTETKIAITNANIVENVIVQEGNDEFGVAEKELLADTKYVTTEINVREMLEILGQDGSIELKSGETSYIINKETETDENGNAKINYKNATSKLEIKTSNPEKAGIIELKHIKTMTGKDYTREQLQEVQNLKTKLSIEGISKTTEIEVLELKETTSKAKLTIENNKTALSTTEENNVTLGITLITNGEQYDLYKNPKISLKFPEAVEKVELISKPSKQNAEEFTIEVGTFNVSNKTMQIQLHGEQTTYPKLELTQSYIQLNLKVKLDSLALAKDDKIMMAYTNENATQFENEINGVGVAEQTVQISAPSQLIKMFNISSNKNTSLTETIVQEVKEKDEGKTVDFGISLINNKDSDISNLKILGKLPTTKNAIAGQKENTLETTLKGIKAENATIYYTENSSATADVQNAANGWTKDLSTLTNTKLYLIELDSLERGASYTANINAQIPKTISENETSYTQYGVIYDTDTETNVTESSRKIGLASSEVVNINTQITAQVGQDILQDGDVVKEGEVIRYTVKVSNEGVETLEDVQLKLDVPEGTVLLKPRTLLEYKYDINAYFEEIKESERIEELTNIEIPKLTTTEPYFIEYEVRVNEGTATTEIVNKPIVKCGDVEIQDIEIKNKVQESDIRITIENFGDDNSYLIPGGNIRYRVFIENLSNNTINDLEFKIISNGVNVNFIDDMEYTGSLPIDQITSGEQKEILVYGTVLKDLEQFYITAIANNSKGEISRANLLKETCEKVDATISMTSPQKGKVIQQGDIVEYNINVKNKGRKEAPITIEAPINELLEVQEIYLNNEVNMQKTEEVDISNNISFLVELKPEEEANLKIITKVKYIPAQFHGKTLSNSASINIRDTEERYSEIVTHVLMANGLQDEHFENIINGYAWYDYNENGKKDFEEEVLQGVKVKLYNLNTQEYLEDEAGNVLCVETDQDGQYIFSKIEDGSYLIVFEYDTEKYVLTTHLADNIDSSLNSKASIKTIIEGKYKIRLAAIEIKELKENVIEMNIGLKENLGDVPMQEQPGIEEIPDEPEQPENPDQPTKPDEPTNPDNPENPEEPTEPDEPINPDIPSEPTNPDQPNDPDDIEKPDQPNEPENSEDKEEIIDTKTLSGFAWIDLNGNGKKDKEESYLSGIKVRLYNIWAEEYLVNEVITDEDGRYKFTDVKKGSYIVIFEFNTEEYKLSSENTNLVVKKVNINGKEITAAITDTINVYNNISNINIGLKENLKFDLELNKYISKIVVQTNKDTKTYNYEEKTLGKVEIHRKQIQGALVVLEYTIQVKNTGEIVGYARNIVDYLPNGLSFSSELNKDWYLSGNNLYTKSLENVEINPGEEKQIKLILTKTMTEQNVGLINNTAEIYQDYNQYGETDIDSTPNNQSQNEDDFGTTDVIIQVATGGTTTAYIILVIVNILLIYAAIKIMIINGIIEIKTKEERR